MRTLVADDTIINDAYNFVKDHQDDSDERQQAQSWIKDFLEKVFHINPRKVNAGFEWRVKSGRYQQYADHLLNGILLIEMKSRGKSLDRAKSQAYNYVMKLEGNDIPRYVMLCDFEIIKISDLDTGSEIVFPVKELASNIEVFDFLKGKEIKIATPQSPVNAKAANLLETLHIMLREKNYPRNATELLMTRIVFCMFADHTGIFESGQYRSYILKHTKEDGSDIVDKMGSLFIVLNTPENERYQQGDLGDFRYINGGLFNVQIPTGIRLNKEIRDMLLEISQLDWSQISPIIFGSMFEGAMDEKKRHDLGAHFTSEINIMKVLDSLFLDDLNTEFQNICNLKIGKLNKLNEFHKKISNLIFLDPACGSGNFLMLAYRELRRLEHEVVNEVLVQEWKQNNRGTLGAEYQDTLLTIEDRIMVEVSQFYGIELQPYAVSIAKLGLWLIDHLMNMEASNKFGQYFIRLPLHAGANIYADNALKANWEDIVPITKLSYILGNPPFIGHNVKSGDNQKELKSVAPEWKGIANLDYVSGWFIKASKMMECNPLIETAFVSTNSIAQGIQAINLFSELFCNGFNINFAHQTFEWDNNGAKVHVIIIGFSKFKKKQKKLYKYSSLRAEPQLIEVSDINEYLLPMKSVKLTAMYTQISGKPNMIYGSNMSTGTALMFKEKEYQEFIRKVPWTEEYMRPLIGAKELTNNFKRYVLYLKDAKPSLINSSNEVLERLNKVKSDRGNSTDTLAKQIVNTPTLLYSDRVLDGEFLVIPIVSSGNREYIPIVFEKYPTIATNKTFQLPNANKYIFGILESRMHMCWMKITVGRLKSDYSYSNTLVYNTFVFPETSKIQEEFISNLADKILAIREEYFEKGEKIKDLYSSFMPPDLRKAHNKLDKEVEKLYRKEPFNSDEDRFEHLLKLYRRKAAKIL